MTIPKTIATTDMPWMEIAPARRVCMGRRRPLEKPLQPIAEEHSLSNGELMALLFLRLVASKQRAIMKDLHRLSELAFRYQSMEPDIVGSGFKRVGVGKVSGAFSWNWRHKTNYEAMEAAKWGLWGWLTKGGKSALIDILLQLSSAMVNIQEAALFVGCKSDDNYPIIQLTYVLLNP